MKADERTNEKIAWVYHQESDHLLSIMYIVYCFIRIKDIIYNQEKEVYKQ